MTLRLAPGSPWTVGVTLESLPPAEEREPCGSPLIEGEGGPCTPRVLRHPPGPRFPTCQMDQ